MGPGFLVQGATDILGPFPNDWAWTARLFTVGPVEQNLVVGQLSNPTGSQFSIPMGYVNDATTTIFRPIPVPILDSRAVAQTPARLSVELTTNTGAVEDQTSIEVVPNFTVGLATYLGSVTRNQAQAQGGFVQSDRDTLELVLNSVWRSFAPGAPGGTTISMAAIDALRGPPRSVLRRFGSAFISGQGTLSAVPPGGFHSFGGTWSIQTLPPQLGVDHGIVFEYHRRLAQFVVLRDEPTSDLYVDVLEDSHWSDNFILWQFPNPIQIQYDVAPGVVLIWNWLV
jgi:hypothetical protein